MQYLQQCNRPYECLEASRTYCTSIVKYTNSTYWGDEPSNIAVSNVLCLEEHNIYSYQPNYDDYIYNRYRDTDYKSISLSVSEYGCMSVRHNRGYNYGHKVSHIGLNDMKDFVFAVTKIHKSEEMINNCLIHDALIYSMIGREGRLYTGRLTSSDFHGFEGPSQLGIVPLEYNRILRRCYPMSINMSIITNEKLGLFLINIFKDHISGVNRIDRQSLTLMSKKCLLLNNIMIINLKYNDRLKICDGFYKEEDTYINVLYRLRTFIEIGAISSIKTPTQLISSHASDLIIYGSYSGYNCSELPIAIIDQCNVTMDRFKSEDHAVSYISMVLNTIINDLSIINDGEYPYKLCKIRHQFILNDTCGYSSKAGNKSFVGNHTLISIRKLLRSMQPHHAITSTPYHAITSTTESHVPISTSIKDTGFASIEDTDLGTAETSILEPCQLEHNAYRLTKVLVRITAAFIAILSSIMGCCLGKFNHPRCVKKCFGYDVKAESNTTKGQRKPQDNIQQEEAIPLSIIDTEQS